MTTPMMRVMIAVTVVAVQAVMADFEVPDWGFQSYLDENFTLVCDHRNLEPHNHVEWKLPDGQMVTQNTEKLVLSHGMRGTVTHMHLTVLHVQDSDAGVYMCHVYNNIRKEVSLGQLVRGLNLGGPKYREPFDEYRDHLMVAGIAALVFFVPMITLCFVYKFRYQTKEERAAKHAARLENTKHQRYLQSHGQGDATAELSEVTVNGGKGESNPAYDNASEESGTRL